MQLISEGIAKTIEYLNEEDENYNKNKKILNDIVNLHYDWAKKNDSEFDIQCFTIREIETVIECLKNNEDLYTVLMTIYGGRFRSNKNREDDKKYKLKNKFKEKINYKGKEKYKYESLKDLEGVKSSLPEGFPECYQNEALIQTVQSVLLALRNKRNVIISGDNESGLTQVAEWCSLYFNEVNNKKRNKSYICFCTKNLECSDLIGRTKIKDDDFPEILKLEGLKNEVSELNLKKTFSKYGEVISCIIDKKVESKIIDYLQFKKKESAQNALKDINNIN